MRTDQPTPRPTRAASPWWPRREPWRNQGPVIPGGLPPAAREDQLPPGPPPSPPLLNRVAGAILLAATLGLASCQSFIGVFS